MLFNLSFAFEVVSLLVTLFLASRPFLWAPAFVWAMMHPSNGPGGSYRAAAMVPRKLASTTGPGMVEEKQGEKQRRLYNHKFFTQL